MEMQQQCCPLMGKDCGDHQEYVMFPVRGNIAQRKPSVSDDAK